MKRTSAIDFMGVVRIAGYSLAMIAALLAAALFVIGLLSPRIGFFVAPLLMPTMLGLLVAWVASLSRLLLRRMHFASPQD